MPPVSGTRPSFANASMKLAERRGDHQIAGERDVGARACGNAVDGADDRHRQRAQRKHQRLVVAFDRCAEIDRRAARRHRAVGEVLPRAEASAGAGDEQDARRGLRAHARNRIAHFRVHRVVEAVETVRTIEGETGGAAFQREENVLVAHG